MMSIFSHQEEPIFVPEKRWHLRQKSEAALPILANITEIL
jgi:hypothetical protein